jgi:hypothetical protein
LRFCANRLRSRFLWKNIQRVDIYRGDLLGRRHPGRQCFGPGIKPGPFIK